MMSFLFQSTSKLQDETKVGDKLRLDFVSKSMETKKHHTAQQLSGRCSAKQGPIQPILNSFPSNLPGRRGHYLTLLHPEPGF